MCITCNTDTFEEVNEQTIDKTIGCGSLQILCDKKCESFYFTVQDQPNSRFRTYHCSTCGKKFY